MPRLEDIRAQMREMSDEDLMDFIGEVRQSRLTTKSAPKQKSGGSKASGSKSSKSKGTSLSALVDKMSPEDAAELIKTLEAQVGED